MDVISTPAADATGKSCVMDERLARHMCLALPADPGRRLLSPRRPTINKKTKQ